jgi:hypothetical protein
MMMYGIIHHSSKKEENAGPEGLKLDHPVGLIDALHYVKSRRPVVSPNEGFMAQLVDLESKLNEGNVTVDLKKYSDKGRFADVHSFSVRAPTGLV